jgi:hypothetical protein
VSTCDVSYLTYYICSSLIKNLMCVSLCGCMPGCVGMHVFV